MTERNAAVHTARTLLGRIFLTEGFIDFLPIPDPNRHWSSPRQVAIKIEESSGFTHEKSPSQRHRSTGRRALLLELLQEFCDSRVALP
jgi:hypothetical protein